MKMVSAAEPDSPPPLPLLNHTTTVTCVRVHLSMLAGYSTYFGSPSLRRLIRRTTNSKSAASIADVSVYSVIVNIVFM